METLKHIFIVVIMLGIVGTADAQIYGNDPEIEVDGLSQENVWQVIEMALVDISFNTGKFNPAEGYLYSDWFQWTSIAITNHARTYYTFDGTTMIIHVVEKAKAPCGVRRGMVAGWTNQGETVINFTIHNSIGKFKAASGSQLGRV